MEDNQPSDAMLPTGSHAWTAWKGWAIAKGHMWRRFVWDTFDSMTFGVLWNEDHTDPMEASCGGEDCDDASCPACTQTPAEKVKTIEALRRRHDQSKRCSLCSASGTVIRPSPC